MVYNVMKLNYIYIYIALFFGTRNIRLNLRINTSKNGHILNKFTNRRLLVVTNFSLTTGGSQFQLRMIQFSLCDSFILNIVHVYYQD